MTEATEPHEPHCVAMGSPLDGWSDPSGCDCVYGLIRDLYHEFDAIGNLPPDRRASEFWIAVRPLWQRAGLPLL